MYVFVAVMESDPFLSLFLSDLLSLLLTPWQEFYILSKYSVYYCSYQYCSTEQQQILNEANTDTTHSIL